MNDPLRVLICGTGSSAHMLAAVFSVRPGVEVRLLTKDGSKARFWNQERVRLTVRERKGDHDWSVWAANPFLVTDKPELAVPGADLIIIAIPAFTHETYLGMLEPHIERGCVMIGLPGQNGFEFAVRAALGSKLDDLILMNFDSFPWICRTVEFARRVDILGTKSTVFGAMAGPLELSRIGDPLTVLRQLLGQPPHLLVAGHPLAITLMAINAYSHPPIMYGRWKDWRGESFADLQLFYRGVDMETANLMEAISAEVVATSRRIMDAYPHVDLSQVIPVYDWDIACYGDVITDRTNEMTVLHTNPGYRHITHPMTRTEDQRYVPDFNHRFLTEDVPFGLVVVRGIAEITGVPTPNLDKVLCWCQKKMGRQYLVNGKLTGEHIPETRCPQRYGYHTLSDVLGL